MKKILFSILSICCFTYAQAATITVCASGCDQTTIADAIAAASAGDVIDIQDAVHTENTITIDKSLTIKGQGMNSTIVQASAVRQGSTARIFYINNDLNVVIEDLTIRHGNANSGNGGGAVLALLRTPSSSLTFTRVSISENNSDGIRAAGFYILGSNSNGGGTLYMTDCRVDDNIDGIGHEGANRIAEAANGVITNCSFSGNQGRDGTISFWTNSPALCNFTFTNCTFHNNSCTSGGAMRIGQANVDFVNCTFTQNSAGNGGVLYLYDKAHVTTKNCIFYGNTATGSGDDIYIRNNSGGNSFTSNHDLVTDCHSADGSTPCPSFAFSADPMLGSVATCNDTDYFPLQAGSPAIDVGTATGAPGTDQCGLGRSGGVDLGASEFGGGAAAVPTMGEWALIIFGLIILSFGIVTVMRWERVRKREIA